MRRISVNKDDPGFSLEPHRYVVYLNGKRIKDCFTADEEQGYVDCYYRDNAGNFWINENRIVPMRMWGKVRIECIPSNKGADYE